ncbi:MAG: DMT family transporter [Magnetospirillum sp.]|nr:DMT family transporter [Magnetospirillum sp.]
MILGAVAIGFAPIFVRLSEVGPVATGFHRLFWSLPVFALLAWMRPIPRPDSGQWRVMAASGAFFAGDMIVWHLGILLTSVANASLFTNMAPIFVALALWLIWGRRPSGRFVVALAVTVAGAAALVGGAVDLSAQRLAGDGLSLLSGLFYAGYILAVGRAREALPTPLLMAVGGAVAAALILVAALVLGEQVWPRTASGWAVVLGLAVVSQCAGQGLIAWGLAHVSASFGALVLLLQPLVAVLVAWLLFAESLEAIQVVGAGVVLVGIHLARRANRA